MQKKYRIVFANDHGGVQLKKHLINWALEQQHMIINLGTDTEESCDYPDMIINACKALQNKEADFGVFICGSGIGISIAANRYKGIRSALCNHHLMSQLSRQHNNANVLALGQRLTGIDVAIDCLDTFLNTQFKGGRHDQRIAKLDK